MTKAELVSALQIEAGISKRESGAIVNLFFDELCAALAKGERVEIRGLCTFYIKRYAAYDGRNPKTGEKIRTRPKKLPFFKCGKDLKDRVNR
jgi:integration host factor subunit beta